MAEPPISEEHATYRAIIDDLVSMRASMRGRLIREGRLASVVLPLDQLQQEASAPRGTRKRKPPTLRGILERMSAEERKLVADLLDHERSGAIHDVLAALTWWLECRDVSWSRDGKPMPHGYEGGLHCDYVGRCTDWAWPSTASSAPPAAAVPRARRAAKR